MFCYQCQETSQNLGCTKKAGVCGKTSEVADLQDLFIWTLQGISAWGVYGKKLGIYDEKAAFFIDKGLFTTITNADFDKNHFIKYIKQAIELRGSLKEKVLSKWKEKNGTEFSETLPKCATWTPQNDQDIILEAQTGNHGWLAIKNEDIRSLKALIMFGLKGISAYAEHAYQIKKQCKEIFEFLLDTLYKLTDEKLDVNALINLVIETGKMGVETMALLDKTNTDRYGEKEISEVNLGVGKNPGILISGHDLLDLEELLEQTKDMNIDIYTHSEMLPAHYYPKLKKYNHLYGNYGGAWYLQKEEIEKFHGPVLFTSNCIVPPKLEHKNRIFTTGAVGFDGCTHIPDREEGKMKDFSKIIEVAKKSQPPEELESGKIIGGFGHQQVMKIVDKVIAAIKAGKIKRFIVMAGCDGRHKERSYYTDVALKLPKDTIILTAGCAKYRYNKLNLGDIDGIPRVLDAGQCNDSYSLAVIALKLQKAFGLDDVNKLPLSFDIAWYEQKAVLVLLALLYLGFKNIRLGPTLPGFLSKGVTKLLSEKFNIKSIKTPEEDIAEMVFN